MENCSVSTDFKRCIICQKHTHGTLYNVTEKGASTIADALPFQDNNLYNRLGEIVRNVPIFLEQNPVYHRSCRCLLLRKHYSNQRRLKKCEIGDHDSESEFKPPTRKRNKLDFRTCCFLCQKKRDSKGKWELILVSTVERQNAIFSKAKEIQDHDVLTMLGGHGDDHVDMIAGDYRYHRSCMTKFMNTSKPFKPSEPSASPSISDVYDDAFSELVNEISGPVMNEKEIFEISKLRKRYTQILSSKQIETKYKRNRLINRLNKHFGDSIQIVEMGHKNILCSSLLTVGDMCQKVSILQEKLDESVAIDSDNSSGSETDVAHNINSDIFAVGNYTRKVIKENEKTIRNSEVQELGMSYEAASALVPDELYNLIALIITKQDVENVGAQGRISVSPLINEQILNICQDIIGNVTSLPMPKNVGLALYVLRQTRSKDLVTVLNRFGHSISYQDAQRYINTASNKVELQTLENGIFLPSGLVPGAFTHFAFDNLDFNEDTRDGTTLHATSHIIYQQQTCQENEPVQIPYSKVRAMSSATASENIYPESNLNITMRRKARSLTDIPLLNLTEAEPAYLNMFKNETFIWTLMRQQTMANNGNEAFTETVSWNNFFEMQSDENPKTSIAYGPLFPQSPTIPDTVQASLDYFMALSTKLGQRSTVVTCDQAIYDIVKGMVYKYPERYANLVVRLGGFHIAENFMSAIGTLMKGSGIEDLLIRSNVCLPGTVTKVMSGKDYYKMVYCHSTVYESIVQILVKSFQMYLNDTNEGDRGMTLSINELVKAFIEQSGIRESVNSVKECLQKYLPSWCAFCDQLSITGKFWLMYVDMVLVLKTYIQAERQGDWESHLDCVKRMLPYLVAAGRTKYSTCIPLYLHDMNNLSNDHPEVHTQFMNGLFTVRQVPGKFNGVWSDLALEQTYNKEGKTALFKGISQQPEATQKYIQAIPFLTRVSEEVKAMAHVKLQPSQHHRQTKKALECESLHVQTIADLIENELKNPFTTSDTSNNNDLVNIVTCQKCQTTDLARARELGLNAIKKADSENSFKIETPKFETFVPKSTTKQKKNDAENVLKSETSVTRALCFLQNADDETRDIAFSHEWADYPPALFKPDPTTSKYIMRKGTKSDFLSELLNQVDGVTKSELPHSELPTAFVVDFMAFVQRYQTMGAKTFVELSKRYIQKLDNLKPQDCNILHIVGDRYDFSESESLKVDERENRSRKKQSSEYIPEDFADIPEWKGYIGNQCNKANLVSYVSEKYLSVANTMDDEYITIIGGTFKERTKCVQIQTDDVKIIDALQCAQHEEADTRIMAHLAYSVSSRHNVTRAVIMCTDTDVIILSMYFLVILGLSEMWIRKNDTYLAMHELVRSLTLKYSVTPRQLVSTLLTAYVFSGCDTTSYPFKKGKRLAAKTGLSLLGDLDNLSKFGISGQEEVTDVHFNEATKYFSTLYGKPHFTSLTKLRQHMFVNSRSDLRSLPPTDDAFRQHVLRCMYQLLIYHRAACSVLDLPPPTTFGRTVKGNRLVPVLALKSSKPKLVKTVACKCKKTKCLKNCTCSKANVECFIGCSCLGSPETCGRVTVDEESDG